LSGQTSGYVRHFELKSRCTTNPYRQVARWIDEAVLDRMETRLKANPEILRQRREIVEHPFGSIKQWMNQGAFLMRGLEKVRAEFSLTALAYNMTRVLTIVILTPTTSLLRMWQAEELFRRGARTLSQDLDRHFERLPLLVQRRNLQFYPCDRGD
jgi:hypothetical protein